MAVVIRGLNPLILAVEDAPQLCYGVVHSLKIDLIFLHEILLSLATANFSRGELKNTQFFLRNVEVGSGTDYLRE